MKEDKKEDDFKPYDRGIILSKMSKIIESLEYKTVGNGRITKPENEKIRIQYYKALIYAMDIFNKILKDKQLDNLHNELETIRLALINKEHETDKENLGHSEKVDQVIEEIEELIDNV